MIKNIFKHLCLFVIGGLIYGIVEILARGYTHWSMVILGGACFVILGMLNEVLSWDLAITTQMLIGSIVITIAELLVGCLLNLWLGWNVWDYSDKPYNLLGQICAENSFYWLLLSGVGIVIDDYIRYRCFKEEKPMYRL